MVFSHSSGGRPRQGSPWSLCSLQLGSLSSRLVYRHRGRGALTVQGLADLLGDPHGLLDESLDDLRLGNGLDDLALDEDLALAIARGDAEVRLPSLAGPVHDAAHHRDPQRTFPTTTRSAGRRAPRP